MINENQQDSLRGEVKEILEKRGIDLVEFKLFNRKGVHTFRCMVDYPEGGIDIDACAEANRTISDFLESREAFGGDYEVEVNSPGLDRVLHSPDDFARVKGKDLSIWFVEQFDGKESMDISVKDVSSDTLTAGYKDGIVEIPFKMIKSGKERITFK